MFTKALLAFSFGALNLQASSMNLNIIRKRAAELKIGIASDSGHFYDASATPVGALPQETKGDAPWTQSEASYQRMIYCPRGAENEATPKGIVLLVPGTASNASESYQSSAYYQVLPSLGFNVCLVNTPNYSLSDMQLSAEFIAYAIKYLAPKSTSTGGKINVVSYSQGGANVQWASTFWPSIQKLVKGHVALAPPMKGTALAALGCPLVKLADGCHPSVVQQSSSSVYMRAANSHADKRSAAYALIPTTIIYTLTDDVVTPQVGPDASSRLIGSTNIAIQSICGITHNPDHFTILADVGVYGIALDALENGRPAKDSTINRSYCTKTAESLGFFAGNLANYLEISSRTVIGDPSRERMAPAFRNLLVKKEPPLQQYVCDRLYSTYGCTRNGFKRSKTTGLTSDTFEADGFGW